MISSNMLTKALCLTLVLGRASAICLPLPKGHAIGKTVNVTIESGGVERWYLVTIPFLFDCEQKTPIILSFHGAGKDASQQMELSQMSNPHFNNFAFAVYPQGIDNTWQGVPGAATTDDRLFTENILNQLEQDYPIDTQRIWATGKSDGASFTNTLACDFKLSKRIAAFAPVSGAYYVDTKECDAETVLSHCNPGRSTIPIIEFHGKTDSIVPFNGGSSNGQCLPSIPQFIRNWAMRNSLGLRNTITQTRKDTFVTKYGSDFDYGLVTLVVDDAIGHDWPSTVENDDNKGKLAATFNATPVIIDFFQKHPMDSAPRLISQQRRRAEGDSSASIQPSIPPSTVIPVQTSAAVSTTSAAGGEETGTSPPPATFTGAAYKMERSMALIGTGLFAVLAIIL